MKLYYKGWAAAHTATYTEDTSLRSYVLTSEPNGAATCKITLADPTGARFRFYTEVQDFAGAVASDGGAETDETTEANNATADDMTLFPLVPVKDDAYYFGFADKIGGLLLDVTTITDDDSLMTWEYSQGADAWAALADVAGNYGFTSAGIHPITWTVPGDWATDEVGSIASLYWVRARYNSVVVNLDPVPLAGQAFGLRMLGPGRIKLEDPDTTAIFDGRITKVTADTNTKTCTLHCKDWLSQLNELQIDYDMREDLDGAGLRESVVYPDIDDADGHGVVPAFNNAGTYYIYDGEVGLTADAHNGQYLVFGAGMAGTIEQWTGPYSENISLVPDTTNAGDITDVWDDDGNIKEIEDANSNFYIQYNFHSWIMDSGWFDSILEAYIDVTACDEDCDVEVQIYDGTSSVQIGIIPQTGTDEFVRDSFRIPDSILSTVWNASGDTHCRLYHGAVGGNLKVDMVRLRTICKTTASADNYAISDGETYRLTVDTNFAADATKVWCQMPYSIIKEIYKHIDTAEGGTLVSSYDTLVALTAAGNIDHSSGLSSRNYQNRTPLEILQDLATYDKVMFWLPLGTTELYWKTTFGASTETLDDGDINQWTIDEDYEKMHNSVTVRGIRINDHQVEETAASADSVALYGATRSQTITNTGAVTDHHAAALAAALAARDDEPVLFLTAELKGMDSSYRLGTIVEVTSTYLGLTAIDYVVVKWQYDSTMDRTMIRLHPKQSTYGFVEYGDNIVQAVESSAQAQRDQYVPDLYKQEW